jgi:hypothetical protein
MSVFSHAGVSKLNGEFKVRFANDALRVKVLAKNGHKDIDIIELKTPMSKEDAVAYLLSINFDNGNKAVRAALEGAADKRGVSAPKATKTAKPVAKAPAKTKATKPAVKAQPVQTETEAIAAVTADLEDAPF